jgi:hypothetical protein
MKRGEVAGPHVRAVTSTPIARGALGPGNAGTAFDQQLPQDRSVASTRVVAVAPHRQTRPMGERGQKIENPSSVRCVHFSSELPLKDRPRSFVVRRLALLHEDLAGRKCGQPHIEKIPLGIFGLRNSSGRPANRAKTQTFLRFSRGTQSDHCDGHRVTTHCLKCLGVAERRRL